MNDKSPVLKATKRDRLGTRYTKRVRKAGGLPAVVYGHGSPPVSITVDAEEVLPHLHKGEKVYRLELAGEQSGQIVLLKELQFDYLGTDIVHADFRRVDLNERVRTRVHVDLQGEAKGLKNAGAILMHPTTELVVECRVTEIPDSIPLDISELDLNGVITAAQVKLPGADMKLITDSHAIIAQIVEQKEEVVAEAAVVATEGGAEPEVIGEKERAEKAAAAAADGKAPAKDAKAAAAPAKAAGGAPAKAAAAPAKDAKAKK
ncbi:MAG: 50S ribosomal protein L25 [Phycisphaerae bacterium]|nr:50S ribosomal protein L25 [Phycisphaerae bacterium]